MSCSARAIRRSVLTALLSLTLTGLAAAQYPMASIHEIAQESDLVFVGEVLERASSFNDEETAIVTEVQLANEQLIHAGENAQQADDEIIQLSYLGGVVDSTELWVSESPAFEAERRYVVFTRDDGEQYLNPLLGGNQGLFQVIEDRETQTSYVLTAGGQAVIDADEEGLITSSRLVDYVENGEVFWQSNEQIDQFISTENPTSDDEAAEANAHHPEEDYTTQPPMTLDQFIEYIQGPALATPVEEPVLRLNNNGAWYREEDGEVIEEELPGAKEYAAGGGSSAGKTGSAAGPQGIAGQTLQTCGAQNLNIVMEDFDPRKQEHDNAMATWNDFVDIYRTTSDDGTYAADNGDNEFIGFPTNSDLNSVYGRNWNGDLAVTMVWSHDGCGTITETDLMYNPNYSWSDNLSLVVDNSNLRSFRWTAMHELGHTWGFQNVNEAYNYDHPTVMHGGYATDIMEDGWGIHAVGANLVRRHYSNQASAESIVDVGVESYYAQSGSSQNALQETVSKDESGSETTQFYPGQKITVDRITVENMSSSSVPIELTFYLSDDWSIDASDHELASFSWGSMSSENYYSGDLTMKIPFEMREHTGRYYVGAIVEVPDQQDDFTRNNTTRLVDQIEVLSPLTISGTVADASGDPIPDVTIDGFPAGIGVTTGPNGTYEGPIPYDFSGDITPVHDFYTFSPSEESFSGLTSAGTADFTGTRKTADISGYVRDASSAGIPDVVMEGLPGSVTTSNTGYYEATVEQGYDYTVTPRKTGYNFTPVSATFTEIGQDESRDFTGERGGLSNSDWPQFRKGQRHSGFLPGEPLTAADTGWRNSIGGDVHSSPAIGPSGTVYIGSDDESLHAYTAGGQEKWTFPTDGWVRSSPAIGAGEIVYVGSYDNNLYAVAPDGSEEWSYATEGAIAASPAVGPDGTVYVGSTDEHLHAVSSTGNEEWTFPTDGNVLTAPAIAPDSTIVFGSSDGNVYALSPDGVEKWSYQTGDRVTSSPAIDARGVIYIGSDDGSIYALTPDGQLKWDYSTGDAVSSSPAIGSGGGRIYVGSEDHTLYALDSTGTEQWSYTTGGPIKSSPAVHQYKIVGVGYLDDTYVEMVYVGSDDEKIYGIQGVGAHPATPQSGAKRWEYYAGGQVISSPALTENTLYVGAFPEWLHKLEGPEPANGQVASYGVDPEMEEKIHIAIMMAEGDLFGLPAVLGPETPGGEGGCEGGPRIIPDCGAEFGRYGSVSDPIDLVAGLDVRFQVIREGYLEEVISGESTEGLLGGIDHSFDEGERFFAVVSGVPNPEAYLPNPDDRSTELRLFVKENHRPVAESPETVRLFGGHFVPDGSTMEIMIEGAGETVQELRYGDMSQDIHLEPARYEVVMQMEGEVPGKSDEVAAERVFELDLRERGGETIGLFASGFLRPEANNDGPALRMQTLSAEGESTTLGSDEETGTSVEEVAAEVPERFELRQNYPNPFNPSTTIEYALPEAARVQLTVYNVMGEKVREFVDRRQSAGRYTVEFDASTLPSGMYLYRLETPDYRETRSMMLVK